MEERLAISESKRMELEKQLEAYKEKGQAPEKNEDPAKERELQKIEMLRRVHEGEDDGPIAKKKKTAPEPQNLLGSPIVLSEDSSDEGATVVSYFALFKCEFLNLKFKTVQEMYINLISILSYRNPKIRQKKTKKILLI